MKKLLKRYSVIFDILLCINFVGVVAVALGASLCAGDARCTVALGAINTLIIVIARVLSYNTAEKERGRRNDI